MSPRRRPNQPPPLQRPRTGDGRVPSPRRAPSRDGLGGDQVEGRRSVLELLRGERRVRRVLLVTALEPAPILDEIERAARRRHVPVDLVSESRLERVARTEGHQGVVALAEPLAEADVEDLMAAPDAFLVVCDGVTDPRNLGALLRSADGAGVTGVLVPRHRATRVTPAVTKTAAGAIEHLAIATIGGVPAALARLNDRGVLTVGLDADGPTSLYDVDLRGPVALVVGGEQDGLSQLARKRCAVVAAIPQHGALASLNAGVAASLACFEVARQRRLG